MTVDTAGSSWHQSNRGVSIYIGTYLTLLLLVTLLSKFLHDKPKLGSYLPEAAMIILVGMSFGLLLNLFLDDDSNQAQQQQNNNEYDWTDDVVQSMLSFSPTVFFVVLLPPIIFNSGYHLRRDLFFQFFSPIVCYACVGTAISTMAVGSLLYLLRPLFPIQPSFLELLTFGALISATDPVSTLAVFSSKHVDPKLFYLVFGESVLNDAVGLVLFDALAHLVERNKDHELLWQDEVIQFIFDFSTGFLGSIILGTLFALLYGLVLKCITFTHPKATLLLETTLYLTMMYAPYMVAEIAHLSGIVTVLFTGIAGKRYAEPNLTREAASLTDRLFRLTAHLTETIIFLELGLSVFGLLGTGAFYFGFFLAALGCCLIGRAVNIYPITWLLNFVVAWRFPVDACMGTTTVAETELVPTNSPTNYVDAERLTENNAEKPPSPTVFGQEAPMDEAAADVMLVTNNTTNEPYIPYNMAHMLWFSGLRGAVSYGLVRIFPATENKPAFVVTTMLLVLFTTFLLGGSTEKALEYLGIRMNVPEGTPILDSNGDSPQVVPPSRFRARLNHWEQTRLLAWVLKPDVYRATMKQKTGTEEDALVVTDGDQETTTTEQQDVYHQEPVEHTLEDHNMVATSIRNSVYDFCQ